MYKPFLIFLLVTVFTVGFVIGVFFNGATGLIVSVNFADTRNIVIFPIIGLGLLWMFYAGYLAEHR